jgi:hypothetical protein
LACQIALARSAGENRGVLGGADVQREEVSAFRHGGTSSDTEAGPGPRGPIGRGNSSGPIKIALHYENGGVVAEANSLTEVFGTLKNVVHQLFR